MIKLLTITKILGIDPIKVPHKNSTPFKGVIDSVRKIELDDSFVHEKNDNTQLKSVKD